MRNLVYESNDSVKIKCKIFITFVNNIVNDIFLAEMIELIRLLLMKMIQLI